MSANIGRSAAPIVVLLSLAAAPALAQAPTQAPRDWHPNDVEVSPAPAGVSPGVVRQVGEIVVMEGDPEICTNLGGDDYAIEAMENIGMRFYMNYPDDFDGLAVFSTFPDLAQGGLAYALILGSGFGGVGIDGGASPQSFGSAGRMISFINMNDVNSYGSLDYNDNFFHEVFGQEFGHTWLSFMQFIDPGTGLASDELLGRDAAHWSALFASGSSVMDGQDITDNGDGTFTVGAYSTHYGPLDLYAMGIYRPEEVGPMFVLRNAQRQGGGGPVGPLDSNLGFGSVLTGTRVDFDIDDIIAAEGPRTPAADDENEDFRIAWILVTKHGQTADDPEVVERLAKMEAGRLAWEHKHREWTMGRSTMCTDVTARCPLSFAEVETIDVSEDPEESDGDGIIEPGDRIRVAAIFRNDGALPADTALATLTSATAGVLLPEPETLPEIPVGGTLEHVFYIEIEGDACGANVDLTVQSTIETRNWRGQTTFRPGVLESETPESFATTDGGYIINPAGEDNAIQGMWEYGIPQPAYFAGRMLQSNGGADGLEDGAWVTGLSPAWDTGEVAGRTTLESAPFDMTGFVSPALRYTLWYTAYDRPDANLVVSPLAHLTVEVSGDGGQTWHVFDEVSGEPVRWEQREAPIGDALSEFGADVRFRFVVSDDQGPDDRLVEVGIDNVSVITLSGSCETGAGESGGCCNVARTPRQALGSAALALLVGLALRRRRRPARA